MSSARIPLLSLALPFLSLLIAACISSSVFRVFFHCHLLHCFFLHQLPWYHGSRYFEAYRQNRLSPSSPYYLESCFGFCCSYSLSYRCFSWTVHCILSSLASLLLLRCLHLLDGHAVRTLLHPSPPQLSPSELQLSFPFLFCYSFRRLCGASIFILLQIGLCGCGFVFDLFFEFLISFFERECFIVNILFTNPCTEKQTPNGNANEFPKEHYS